MTSKPSDADGYRSAVFAEHWPVALNHDTFHIITAWDPPGRRRTPPENNLADQQLYARFHGLGLQAVRVTGCSPDFAHREPGWAAACTRQQALALAAEFDQAAVFCIAADELVLVWADGREELLGAASPRFR